MFGSIRRVQFGLLRPQLMSLEQVRYSVRTKRRLRRPLGKPTPKPKPFDSTWVPDVELYNKINAINVAERKARIEAADPKPIPYWRTHVSLMVHANKRDIWALLEQWDKMESWHPDFVTESTRDMPPTWWMHDKQVSLLVFLFSCAWLASSHVAWCSASFATSRLGW
jgi:hypothetical protein